MQWRCDTVSSLSVSIGDFGLINIIYIDFVCIGKPHFGSNLHFTHFFFGPVHPQPWHRSFGLFGAPCCFENSHRPEASKSWLPNLFYYWLMLLIRIQPNMTWLSGSVSKVLLKFLDYSVQPLYACMRAEFAYMYTCTHTQTHAEWSKWLCEVELLSV